MYVREELSNNDHSKYMFQQMLGVCGTSLVSPGWLGVTVGMWDVQTLRIRHYNVIQDHSGRAHRRSVMTGKRLQSQGVGTIGRPYMTCITAD